MIRSKENVITLISNAIFYERIQMFIHRYRLRRPI